MIDNSPNDLSHLSDKEFNALCPQGEHAPGPEPLSPAAQAVLDAYVDEDRAGRLAVAAALRAAADQVAPNGPKPSADSDYHLMYWTRSLDQYYQRQQIREELLTIAAELDGGAR